MHAFVSKTMSSMGEVRNVPARSYKPHCPSVLSLQLLWECVTGVWTPFSTHKELQCLHGAAQGENNPILEQSGQLPYRVLWETAPNKSCIVSTGIQLGSCVHACEAIVDIVDVNGCDHG